MKKILIVGLVLVLVLGLGIVSYAHYNNNNQVGGFGPRQGFGTRQGFGPGMMQGEYFGNDTMIEILSELTGLTEDEIYDSGLPLHEIAEENNVLEAFLENSLNERIERIDALVEDGVITEAYGKLMINQMTEMNDFHLEEGFSNTIPFGQRNSNFRDFGHCGRRW